MASESIQELLGPGGTSLCALPLPCVCRAVAERAPAYRDEHLSGFLSEHVIGADIRADVFLSGITVCNHMSCTGRVYHLWVALDLILIFWQSESISIVYGMQE